MEYKKEMNEHTKKEIRHSYKEQSASLVAQLVKNPLAMRETWVQSLGLGRSPVLRSFNGPEPGGTESTIRK